MITTGTLESIEYCNSNGHEKKVLTINQDCRQKAFLQVRKKDFKMLESVREGDDVEIYFFIQGKISKNSGIQYNNLIAVDIRKQ